MQYYARIADNELKEKLESFGAVSIVGPKWCGKTTTAKMQSKSIIELNDPDMKKSYLGIADTKPSLLLKGEVPRLIDEWQEIPELWDAVRVEVDRRQEHGQFILTGSTSVDTKKITHTGTGRIARMKMYPMSLYESKESNGEISLEKLFEDYLFDIDGIMSEMNIEDLIFAACRGGWPSVINEKSSNKNLLIAKEYINNVCDADISTVDGITRNPQKTRLLLRSYARNISTLASKKSILKDFRANDENMSETTFDSYLNALERLYVIEDIPAWMPAIRSATVIRAQNKRGFTDPSIAVAALGIKPDYLETDLNTFGFIFESMCIRDLKVYSQKLGGTLSYYHDRYGLEADAVLHLEDGRYALIEFKLGSKEIEEGAKHLLEIRDLIREKNAEGNERLRDPDLLLVITGGKMAYTRDDGVKVIPIGCLKD